MNVGPAARLAFGIAALSVCLLLVADSVFSIFPDTYVAEVKARQKLAESLGVQFAASRSDDQLAHLRPSMDATTRQNPDVLSMGLRTSDGALVARTSEHERLWEPTDEARATPTHVRIPIYRGTDHWGSLEVRFEPLASGGIFGVLNDPLYKLVAIMAAAGFTLYRLYLRRTLRHLDPSRVVPGRVRAALDQLVEGVFILDENQRIVLVNSAFAEKLGREPESLLGVDPSTLGWVTGRSEGAAIDLPWTTVARGGVRCTDVRLELKSPTRGRWVLTCHVSAVVDGKGKHRGVLATFDDISDTERMNQELQETIHQLQAAQTEVRNKNKELVRIATIDGLTGCLNRRALFERLDSAFQVTRRNGLDLCLLMVDIDHFKRINDQFGHAVGDTVIKQMASVLMEATGRNGFVGRYGGEEFCLALLDASFEEAMQVADQLRTTFAARTSASEGSTPGLTTTASFGVTSRKFGANDVAELLHQADQALYESKSQGRDRVTSWLDMAGHQREAS